MDKVKIGDNEYRLPVTIDSCEETYTCISDENCKEVSKNDIVLALNELAQLRADRDALVNSANRDTILVPLLGGQVVMTPLQIAEVVTMAAKFEQERNALKARVEELEESIAIFPKTCDGFPYVPHEDARTFFCIVNIGYEDKRWFKTTCTTVHPDEMIDDDQIWTVKIADEFKDWDGESCECLTYVLEENRDAMYNRLTNTTPGGDDGK